MDVRYAGKKVSPPSDLDWGELRYYGADSEVAQYLRYHDGACDYEGLQRPADVEAFVVFAKDNFPRGKKGKIPRPFKQFRNKMRRGGGGLNSVFRKPKQLLIRKWGVRRKARSAGKSGRV